MTEPVTLTIIYTPDITDMPYTVLASGYTERTLDLADTAAVCQHWLTLTSRNAYHKRADQSEDIQNA